MYKAFDIAIFVEESKPSNRASFPTMLSSRILASFNPTAPTKQAAPSQPKCNRPILGEILYAFDVNPSDRRPPLNDPSLDDRSPSLRQF